METWQITSQRKRKNPPTPPHPHPPLTHTTTPSPHLLKHCNNRAKRLVHSKQTLQTNVYIIIQSNTLKSKTLKFTLLFSFFFPLKKINFLTKASLCVTNFTTDKSKRISRISTKSNMFSPFPTRISRSQAFQVYFFVEYAQIPNLAAGHLQAFQLIRPLGR